MNPEKNPVWMALYPVALLVGFGLACGGGGGATFGENSPGNAAYGGGTYLDDARVLGSTPEGVGENGSLAVDPDTELTFTLQTRRVQDVEEKRIVVASPEGTSWELMDATGYVDVRILFPPDSVLVMAEPAWSEEAVESGACLQPDDIEREKQRCGDELIWFDKRGRNVQRQIHTNARYHGTRLSPKRNYLIVADNFYNNADIHLLDLETGATNVVPQDADWFEGMWAHREDVLITAHFSRLLPQDTRSESFLTIREWFPDSGTRAAVGQSLCFYREGGQLPEGCDSYAIPGLDPMFFTGFSWIVISPDDRFVAVPAQYEDGTAVVVVVDRETRMLHMVEEAYGPVGFTPDSTEMVAFGWDEVEVVEHEWLPDETVGKGAHLKVVDLQNYEVSDEPMPGMDTPTFFVSHDSSDVVVVDVGRGGMLIVDLERREASRMAGANEAAEGRQYYVPLALANEDPSESDYVVDRRVISASDLKSRTELKQNEDVCADVICEAASDRYIGLQEFVSRTGHQELWLVEGESLLRLDLELGFVEDVAVEGNPRHINILPGRDRLVLDSRGEQRLRFFDPQRRRVDGEASIELGWLAR